MTFLRFLFDPRGRIGRLQWWMGGAVVLVLSLALAFASDPAGTMAGLRGLLSDDVGSPVIEFGWLPLIVSLPATIALTTKRLSDRGYPIWVAAAACGFYAVAMMMPGSAPDEMPSWYEYAFLVLLVWIVVDCGFLGGRASDRIAMQRA